MRLNDEGIFVGRRHLGMFRMTRCCLYLAAVFPYPSADVANGTCVVYFRQLPEASDNTPKVSEPLGMCRTNSTR